MPPETPTLDAPTAPASESPAPTLTGDSAKTTPPTDGDAPATGETAAEQDGKTTEGEGTKADDKPQAPETYEFTPPEGMEIDKDALKSYEDLAREHGLSQEQFDAITKHGLTFFQQQLGQLAEAHANREQGWRETALKDHDLSDGTSLKPEVMANVAHVFEQFGGDDNALRTALVETGAGNHPSIIRALNAIGRALGAAQPPDKGKPASELKGNGFEDIARRRYASN